MRRIVLLTTLLVLFSSVLSARIVEEVSVGMGNDWVTLGIGDNWDDGLSFGAHLSVRLENNLIFSFDLEGYTDKLESASRYDIAKLTASYPFTFILGPTTLTLTPTTGILLSGNLAFQEAQNLLHRILKKDEVFLSYPTPLITAHYTIALEAAYGFDFTLGKIEAVAGVDYEVGWAFDWYSGARLRLDRESYLTLGWRWAYSASRYESQDLQTHRYRGIELTLYHDGAVLSTFFATYPLTGYSYGGWYINPFGFSEQPTFESPDYAIGMGIFLDLTGQRNRSIEVIYKNLSIELRYKNGPIEDAWYQVSSYLVGWRYDLYEGSWALPYLKALAGLEQFALKHESKAILDHSFYPTIAFEAGSYFGRHKQWVLGNLNYRPRLAASLHYIIANEKRPTLPVEYQNQIPSLIFQIGIALEIEHDLH